MNNNQRANQIAIKQFRKELSAMVGDIKDIDKKCLDKAVNLGSAYAKRNTPVISGFMRKSWHVARTVIKPGSVEKSLYNTADYSAYVNYGHRIVEKVGVIQSVKSKNGLKLTFNNRAYGTGVTTGFVKGQFILERAIRKVDKSLEREFKKEVERVNREHDK